MKALIYALYVLVIFITVYTGYMAYKVYDGLVEEQYYVKAKNYFKTKRLEEDLGIKVSLKGSFQLGKSMVEIVLTERGKPLRGAIVNVYLGHASTTKYDRACQMKEVQSGVYACNLSIPVKGKWLVRAAIQFGDFKTYRRWFVDVE